MSFGTHGTAGWRAGRLLWLAALLCLAGCGGGNNAVATLSVTINPSSLTLLVNGTQQFAAAVLSGSGLASDQTVKWLVNDVEGGNSTVGTITTAGVYTAPATVPSPANVTVKAVANLDPKPSATATVTIDSGVHISVSPGSATIGTSESFQFIASVTGTATTDVTWLVNDVVGGSDTVGTISASGLYTAPADVPNPSTVTVKATAQADSSKAATASTSIVTAVDPTLSSISPATAAQGSLFQDVYLSGSNFISTTKVLFNNQVISSDQITALPGGGLLRVRTPATLLTTAGAINVRVQRQSQPSTGCSPECRLTVTPARPAIVGTSPDSAPEISAGPTSINVNGGYFGSGLSITAVFGADSSTRTVDSSASTPLQAKVNLVSGDFSMLGLVPLTLRNAASAQLVASANLAVQPSTGFLPVAGSPVGVGNAPGAVAINMATGIAVVANRLSDSISLINLASPGPPTNVPLTGATGPFAPTGVAVDNLTNRAVVANSGNNTISIVNLATNAVTTINANIFNAPNSVAVNPLTGMALVAYKSTNVASIIDLKLTPPAVIGTVTVAAGPNPQVAIEPRLNWAVVTPGAIPGGLGALAIVDLGRQSLNTIASNGASRSGGIVTITTTASHGVQVGQAVLITGVSDISFNGYFTVASIPSSTTFTYSQSGNNASSGGGLVRYSNPLATFTVSSGVAGISINPETEKAVLADPNSNTVSVLSILDQSVNSLTLTDGCSSGVVCAVATAVNPLTNTAVSVNQFLNTASVIDPGSGTPRLIGTVPVGTGPKAVAIDPGSNLAVVANETANSVSIIQLGSTSLRPVHITQISPPATISSAGAPVTLTILGRGFAAGAVVRLDGVALPAPSSITDRQITVSVPANPFLLNARRFALDVVSGGNRSNVSDFAVIQPVPLGDASCSVPAPRGLAIDPQRDVAVVTSPGCNSISLVSTTSGAVTSTIAVGTNPQGVAVIPRLGKAVVTNRGDGTTSGTASIVSLDDGSICDSCTLTVGSEPLGVAINQDTAMAVVANSTDGSAGNSLSIFSADTGGSITTVSGLNRRPVAVAIDSARNKAAVASASENLVDLVDLSQSSPSITARISSGSLPTGVAFDPSTNLFIATPSLSNTVAIVNADTQQASSLRIGINPTSVAYNFQSSTLVTLNSLSNTVSVVDFLDRRIRAVLSFAVVQGLSPAPSCAGFLGPSGNQQPPCGVDIHPRTNLAVVADGDNHRVLLVPLPR